MSQITDTSTGPFRGSLRRTGLAVAFALVGTTCALAQQTDAERAALSERPLTQEELDLRLEECRLPPPTRDALVGETSVAITLFPELRFLEVLTLDKGYTVGDQDKAILHPELPFGGIGAADICGEALYVALDGGAAEHLSLAVMLRSGLGLMESYPSSHDQIMQNAQLKHSSAAEYLVLPLPRASTLDAVEPIFSTLERIADVPFIDWDGEAIWIRNALFLPLNEEVSRDE